MKTVSGKLINTAPISLSRAAKVISNFSSFDNGASDAISIYLKRASEAFDSLVQFHKDLKAPHSQSNRKSKNYPLIEDDNVYSSSVKVEPKIEEDGVDEKKKKKKQRREKLDMGDVKLERYDGVDDVKIENSIKKEMESEKVEEEEVVKNRVKKKRKSSEEGVDSAELSRKKSKKIKVEH